MYDLDKSVNLQFLVGKKLLQLCLGEYQTLLNFTEEITISIECLIKLSMEGGKTIELRGDNSDLSKNLNCLLSLTIENATNEGGGEITIFFSEGYILTLIDSNKDNESYMITSTEEEIIV